VRFLHPNTTLRTRSLGFDTLSSKSQFFRFCVSTIRIRGRFFDLVHANLRSYNFSDDPMIPIVYKHMWSDYNLRSWMPNFLLRNMLQRVGFKIGVEYHTTVRIKERSLTQEKVALEYYCLYTHVWQQIYSYKHTCTYHAERQAQGRICIEPPRSQITGGS